MVFINWQDLNNLPRSLYSLCILKHYLGLTELEDNEDVKKVEKTLEKQISELEATITRIQAPNMRAIQKLDEAREKLEETNKEFDNARKKAKTAKMNFERIKQERYDLFMKCFDHVSNHIDDIYKNLAKNQSAQGMYTLCSNYVNLYLGFSLPKFS